MNIFLITWRAMGCEVTVQLETEADGNALLSALPAQVEALEAQLSRFRPTSDLMQFNAQAGQWVTVSDVLFDTISAAKRAAFVTNGYFNPLVLPALVAQGYDRSFAELEPKTASSYPVADWHAIDLRPSLHQVRIPARSALDLGGIAKGWAAAHIADSLAPHGACLVNLGGDLVARGAPEGLPGWEVEIEDPFDESALTTLWLRNASLVTSGVDYRRWMTQDGTFRHHIIDPRTGQSSDTDVMTVTVHHPDAATAEAYAKAVLLRGAEAGLIWLQEQWDTAGLVVRRDGAVLATPQLTAYLQDRSVL